MHQKSGNVCGKFSRKMYNVRNQPDVNLIWEVAAAGIIYKRKDVCRPTNWIRCLRPTRKEIVFDIRLVGGMFGLPHRHQNYQSQRSLYRRKSAVVSPCGCVGCGQSGHYEPSLCYIAPTARSHRISISSKWSQRSRLYRARLELLTNTHYRYHVLWRSTSFVVLFST